MLYSPSRHEPLGETRWREERARAGIAAIAAAAEAGFDPEIGLWPLHPSDVGPTVDHPQRGVYGGAAGIVWALDELSASGDVDLTGDYDDAVERLDAGIVREPDESDWPPDDGYLGGRAGVLALAQRRRHDPARADLLAELVAAHAEHPALELLYGSPGTMVLARAEHARTGDPRFADAWRASATHLLETWQVDDELGVRLWTQRLRPDWADRYVGVGHGFAGNVLALVQGDLEPEERRVVERDAVATAARLAVVEGEHANWPPKADRPFEPSSGIRTQWCHGAPGFLVAFGGVGLDDDAWSELMLAAGRLTWDAGPLRDRAGLCHGTAGNAYGLLALWRRTSDELWLDRARRFALHALDQVERSSAPWHSLFTGDLGVALCLRSCLTGDARFPALDWF